MVGFVMFTGGASAGTLFFYGQNLPGLKAFKNRMQFQNTVIRARDGSVLYDMADMSQVGRGRRVVKPLCYPGRPTWWYRLHKEDWLVSGNCGPNGAVGQSQGIPKVLQDATIATEDATFYRNPGFDPFSIGRAAYDNLVMGHIVSGASTITQQLVRRYLLTPKQTLSRKTEEIVLAAEMTQKYPKSKILWYYLNSVFYGNYAYGVQAAAQAYFKTDVWNLDLAQSALIAGLPEAPTDYDPVNNRSAALSRMRHVLHLMYSHGYLANPQHRPEQDIIDGIMQETHSKAWNFTPVSTIRRYPHFVQYAVNQLQSIPELANKLPSGLDVTTTVDPRLQDQAQKIVHDQISTLGSYNVTDGALVSIDVRPRCFGCILSMVGSADYGARGGQYNMADTPRQPGSSFKPFNYIYGFMHRLSPGTTVYDGPISFPDSGNPDGSNLYVPQNYDKIFHGPVTLRIALDNSLNIPAVKVEQYNAQLGGGIRVIGDMAQKMGIKSFWKDNPHCCGWATTLGGMESGVRLVEETAAYGTFANNGYQVPPTAILSVRDRTTGKLLWTNPRNPHAHPVFDPAFAYIMNNVLSDDNSRCVPQVCEFGFHSLLYLDRPAAAKTGTTNGFTDNWTVGYTPDIVTGVWVGNTDNSQMAAGTTGITGAAPIWNQFMRTAFGELNLPAKDFYEPPNVYLGSQCMVPVAYTDISSMGAELYAGQTPYCSVGTSTLGLPVPNSSGGAQTQQIQPAQPVAPAPVQPAPVAPAPAAPTLAPPVVAPPTAAPPVAVATTAPSQAPPPASNPAPVAPAQPPSQAPPVSPPVAPGGQP